MVKQTRESLQKATETNKSKGNYKAKAAIGVVRSDEVFSMQAFVDRLGTTESTVNEMRRRGLKARKDGGYVRILGADYLEYLQRQPVAVLD